MNATSKSSQSPDRRHLIELMQRVNFGRIEGLAIRHGEPVIDDAATRVFRELKFGGDNGPRSEVPGDFELKAQVVELFRQFDQLQDARIEVLVIKYGLPFTMDVESVVSAA